MSRINCRRALLTWSAVAWPTSLVADGTSFSIIGQSLSGGPVGFAVILGLLSLSVICWALVVVKYLSLKRVNRSAERFVESFWESQSLNDLNSAIDKHPPSPTKEVFRSGYAELVRSSQLKEQIGQKKIIDLKLFLQVTMDNLSRVLAKTRTNERRDLERYLPFLALCASIAPFIGLFGTVWGVVVAFQGIAASGSTSLVAVAPGISEALVATAFGLFAAIPAVVGYNIAVSRIRHLGSLMEGFSADFLNIVERYIVTDQLKKSE